VVHSHLAAGFFLPLVGVSVAAMAFIRLAGLGFIAVVDLLAGDGDVLRDGARLDRRAGRGRCDSVALPFLNEGHRWQIFVPSCWLESSAARLTILLLARYGQTAGEHTLRFSASGSCSAPTMRLSPSTKGRVWPKITCILSRSSTDRGPAAHDSLARRSLGICPA
jgi:hypothetical protein